jgi:peptide/nickel transport system substrate-binding protein
MTFFQQSHLKEIKMNNKERIHPAIWDMQSKLRQGRVTRREFLYYSTLLGMSFGTASLMAGCGAEPTSPPATESGEIEPQEEAATSQPKYGGDIKIAMQLQRIDHPARVSWSQGENILRQVSEYLTAIGPDNITHPYLLEKWEVNNDITEWTLYLRQDVTFNNGKKMTADDVIFTMGQWLDESVGSALFTTFSYIGGPQNIEKVDDITIKLHLEQPNIAVPEHLSEYQAIILPTEFEGDFIKQPIGTGAFLLEEYAEGERAIFKRREDYWR